MARTNPRTTARVKRMSRIRKKIKGTAERPRLRVFKSSKHIYAQVIDDTAGRTVAAASSFDKGFEPADEQGKVGVARQIGLIVAERAKSAGVEKVVFDRGGYIYHGRVKSLSEGAREGGLIF
ncbi:MAG: 50S ribosomal protein L18 [Deltaproteobacteria bacterium]|nr:MAG: 50S ribosomal protein L18 [Deltaproteobacteria bacterium]